MRERKRDKDQRLLTVVCMHSYACAYIYIANHVHLISIKMVLVVAWFMDLLITLFMILVIMLVINCGLFVEHALIIH